MGVLATLAKAFTKKKAGLPLGPHEKTLLRLATAILAFVGVVVLVIVLAISSATSMGAPHPVNPCGPAGNIDNTATNPNGGGKDYSDVTPPETHTVVNPINPLPAVTSNYGPRIAPTAGASTFHQGTDYGAPIGTPLLAIADGVVVNALQTSTGYGPELIIKSNIDGQVVFYTYRHQNKTYVSAGQSVKAGQHVADVGNFGISTGPHLHFEIALGSTSNTTDPVPFLQSHGAGNATVIDPATGQAVGLEPGPDVDDCILIDTCGGDASGVVETALSYVGTPYVYGGESPGSGLDCSGMVMKAFEANGMNVPRTAQAQYDFSQHISRSEVRPGDLIFCGGERSIYHVKLVIKADPLTYVHAPSPGKKVETNSYSCSGGEHYGRISGGKMVNNEMVCDAQTPEGAKEYAKSIMDDYGFSTSDFADLEWLWDGESGWRWDAKNPTSGAYGIPQSLPGDKMASAGADWKTNGQTQIKWGLQYIKDRYGSLSKARTFKEANNWY